MSAVAKKISGLQEILLGFYIHGDEVLDGLQDYLEESGDPRLPAFLLCRASCNTMTWPDREGERTSYIGDSLKEVFPEVKEALHALAVAEEHARFVRETAPKVGSYVEPDGWRFGGRLLPETWEAASFRLPTGLTTVTSLAVNVKVTGTMYRYRRGSRWVRVKVEFVGDGEPSRFRGAWMKVD